MSYTNLLPPEGDRISIDNDSLRVPERPVIPYIEGDGIGPDIWAAAQRVFDASVEKAYGGARGITWFEVFAGEKAYNRDGSWLPEDTLRAFRDFMVGIKGPLTTPVGEASARSTWPCGRNWIFLYACDRCAISGEWKAL
jgi:isocitrate dehydrogenase